MNLFRSEEHARRWEQFRPESEEGFISLPDLVGFFGTESASTCSTPTICRAGIPSARRSAASTRADRQASPFWLGTPAPSA